MFQHRLDKENFEVDIRSRRGVKFLRLSVFRDGRIVVTKPYWISQGAAQLFIKAKSEWIKAKQNEFKRLPQVTFLPSSLHEFRKRKSEALELAQRKVDEWNRLYGFAVGTISIRRQKTRWGSCSKKGNLNFNYKILLLPPDLQDYLIVHELCHLEEFNHGKKFWKLVEKAIPDFKERRLRLKSFK